MAQTAGSSLLEMQANNTMGYARGGKCTRWPTTYRWDVDRVGFYFLFLFDSYSFFFRRTTPCPLPEVASVPRRHRHLVVTTIEWCSIGSLELTVMTQCRYFFSFIVACVRASSAVVPLLLRRRWLRDEACLRLNVFASNEMFWPKTSQTINRCKVSLKLTFL